jgi:hypothetical protein
MTTEISTLVKVTVNQLLTMILPITQSTVCNVIYVVDDMRSKTVKGKKQVQKMSQITHCYLNHDYQKKVQKLTENGEFQAYELNGKTKITNTILQSNSTAEFMLYGTVLKKETAKILAYFHNGKEITEAEAIAMELWTDSYYNPTPTKTKGRGTVSEDNDFGLISPYLSRIYRIKLMGQWYEVVND